MRTLAFLVVKYVAYAVTTVYKICLVSEGLALPVKKRKRRRVLDSSR